MKKKIIWALSLLSIAGILGFLMFYYVAFSNATHYFLLSTAERETFHRLQEHYAYLDVRFTPIPEPNQQGDFVVYLETHVDKFNLEMIKENYLDSIATHCNDEVQKVMSNKQNYETVSVCFRTFEAIGTSGKSCFEKEFVFKIKP
ncbi:MAG: hypothetical protein RL757_1742 [Bacteroidota bacterium]|jgi:hypothetical protein